jgi:ribonuclease P protein subunit POP4
MPITQRTVLRHELIGLETRVIRSQNPSVTVIKGRIIDETQNTLVLLVGHEKKVVPKGVVTLQLSFPDWSLVEIDGTEVIGRSEDRLRKRTRRW